MKNEISLKAVLDEKRTNFELTADDKKKKIYAKGIDDVTSSGILNRAKNRGDRAPDFTLKNAVGKEISLSEYLKEGPVVLTWYRGGWCPYCNLTLSRLQLELSNFKGEKANLLAITPEIPDKSITTSEKHNLEFEVLSDVENVVGKKYEIIFTLTPEVAEIYENNFNFHEFYDNDRKELPLAATYVIDQDGTIQYAFLDSDYRNRAEPSDIIRVLKKLSS